MLLTKFINVKINRGNLGFYRNLLNKEEMQIDDIIEVSIDYISKTSKYKVDIKCDICGKENNVSYLSYNKSLNYGFYSCTKCKNIKKKMTNLKEYGVENFNNSDKRKETMILKNGFYNNNRDKSKETCLNKYGVDNVSKSEIIKNIKKDTNIKNWGVDNVFKSEIIKEKIKGKHLENLGVDHPSKSEIIKLKKIETCNNNLGVDYPMQSELVTFKRDINNIEKYGYVSYTNTDEYKNKVINTNLIKYGCEWYMSSNDFKYKSKIKNIDKYGTEHPMQNEIVFKKQQQSGFSAKIYNNLHYRGSYELHFLEFCEENNIYVENGPSIKLKFNDKDKVYFPDFYIPSHNLICEIKSEYYYNKDLDLNLAKKDACLLQGYSFLFIIDKNYKELLDNF